MKNLGDVVNYNNTNKDKIAIICEDVRCSYKQLNSLIDSFACGLHSYGIKKGAYVAIISLNSIDFIAAYFGILRLGAVAVLINVKLPHDDINYILRDSNAELVLNEGNFQEFKKNGDYAQYIIDENDPAILLYTSGSTQTPKGVVLTHNHKWIIEKRTNNNSRLQFANTLIAAPCYHMNGLYNMEVSLAGHSTIILMPKFDAKLCIPLIEKYQVNYITGVPSMMALLLNETELLAKHNVECIKYISVASAPMSEKLYKSIKETFSGSHLWHGYGVTEIGPGLFAAHSTLPCPIGSVGCAISGIDYKIVDGILQIRSPAMMLHYKNLSNDKLTKDGFIITNDLFRIDSDGFYYFLGRADDMFVSGGNNIYPRHVELVIESHESILEAAVIGLDDEIKGVKPYAFITLKSPILISEIVDYIASRLQPGHNPRQVWVVQNLPLTAIGKVDKTKLIEWAKERIL